MKNKIIHLILLIISVFAVSQLMIGAADENPDFSIRQLDETTAMIIDYEGTDPYVQIPQVIDGLTITAIGEKAFYDDNISDVVLPSTVEEIRSKAFGSCDYLHTVKFTGNKPDISDDAFENVGSELSENTLILYPSFWNKSRSNDIASLGRTPDNLILSEYDVSSTGAMNTAGNSSDPLSIIIVIGIFVTIGTVTVIVTVRKREKNEKNNTDELS